MIRLEQLRKTYRTKGDEVPVLRGIDLHVPRGDFVALTGSSGSGKSTLMNMIGCLDVPTSGRYLLDGTAIDGLGEAALAGVRNRRIGFVFQSFQLLPRVSALDNVAQPLVYRGVGARVRRELALAALDAMALSHRAHHRPTELSGGQRQRVAIARALVGQPEVLLADEPTGNLDSRTADDVMSIFERLHASGLTVVVVTHEPDIAARCKRVVRLHDGMVVGDKVAAQQTAART
jgi:putative ABC transport system ATP-binding protein